MSAGPVVIVGGGPAGLAAALELRRRGVADVLVLEREPAAGGIPRHAQHQGFGLRDLRRPLSGPSYARRYAELAAAAGGPLELTGPRGRELLEPRAVVLATGCRERPRSARLVPGSRPEGVMTTGMLQQLVYLKGRAPGTRALVVGTRFLLLDEPFEGVAPALAQRLVEVIHALQGSQLAVLISQSDSHHGASLFVRQYTIERGANAGQLQ